MAGIAVVGGLALALCLAGLFFCRATPALRPTEGTRHPGKHDAPDQPDCIGGARREIAALNWLCEHLTISPEAVTVVGRSLGSGVAVQVAALREVASLVLLSPFHSLAQLISHHYPWLPGFVLRDKFASIDHIGAVRCLCLCIVGEQDRLIPPSFSRALFLNWRGNLEEFVVTDGEHRGLLRNPAVLPVLANLVLRQHPPFDDRAEQIHSQGEGIA